VTAQQHGYAARVKTLRGKMRAIVATEALRAQQGYAADPIATRRLRDLRGQVRRLEAKIQQPRGEA